MFCTFAGGIIVGFFVSGLINNLSIDLSGKMVLKTHKNTEFSRNQMNLIYLFRHRIIYMQEISSNLSVVCSHHALRPPANVSSWNSVNQGV